MPRLNEIEIKSETCVTCRGGRRRAAGAPCLPLLHLHPGWGAMPGSPRPWGHRPRSPSPPAAPKCCSTPRFLSFPIFLPGTSVINTSKGCFALLNAIICSPAPLIESRRCLFVQVGFVLTSLFYFDYFGAFLGLLIPSPCCRAGVPKHPTDTDVPRCSLGVPSPTGGTSGTRMWRGRSPHPSCL